MSSKLSTYLCEKPSQAADLAKFHGLKSSHKRVNHYIDLKSGIAVIHGVGHLFELAPPEYYVPSLKKSWLSASLPIFPEKMEVLLKPEMKPLFNTIKSVLSKTETLIIATDPDPEGELIARDIIRYAKYNGVLKRALYSATDDASLTEAFSNLRPASETEHMANEADIRRRLDWLIGMNCTISFTNYLKSSKQLKKKQSFSIGRVVTALGMLAARREAEIEAFVKVKHFTVNAVCEFAGQKFSANLLYPDSYLEDGKYCVSKKTAETFAQAIKGQKFTTHNVKIKRNSVGPDLPYDLASLQIAADKFNIDADETLTLLQSLYAPPVSLVTYPRTNIRYLPDGMFEDAKPTFNHLNKIEIFKKFDFKFGKKPKAFNSKKIQVHHGIIPTKKPANFKKLTDKQILIYMLISLRYAQQFMSEYLYDSFTAELKSGQITLAVTGKKVVEQGWKKAVLNEKVNSDVDLVRIDNNDEVIVRDSFVEEKTTQPPSRFTTAGLINAMENPDKFETDEEIKKLISEFDGIGTPATRSDAIKRAFSKGTLIKCGKSCKPSSIFTENLKVLDVFNPGFSAILQRNIFQSVDGSLPKEQLFNQIENIVRKMVSKWES